MATADHTLGFRRTRGTPYRWLSGEPRRVLGAIERGRTAALGSHHDEGLACGLTEPSYNSCRNRHCPFPVHVMGALFRGKLLAALRDARRRSKLDLVSRDGSATFRTKAGKTITLRAPRFLHRLLQHVLLARFVKIRH